MTISRDLVGELFGGAWPGTRVCGEPEPLTGGFWAAMYRLRLEGQPPAVPADVVLRIAPHEAMGAKELAVQTAVAEQGFPTPRVHLSGPAGSPFEGPWAVMDFAPGAPPLDGLDGTAALRRAPTILRRLPTQLADTMAALHALDPEPVTAAVRRAAPSVAWRVSDVFAQLETGAQALSRHDIASAVRALADRQPTQGKGVICHGDLHPFNLLVDPGHDVTVVDWTAALYAEPAYDVAFTALLIANPPLDAPPALSAILRPTAALVARRFIARYRRADPTAMLDHLDWYTALHSARILVEYAGLVERHGPGGSGHPWRLITPVAARSLGALTGVEVRRARAAASPAIS